DPHRFFFDDMSRALIRRPDGHRENKVDGDGRDNYAQAAPDPKIRRKLPVRAAIRIGMAHVAAGFGRVAGLILLVHRCMLLVRPTTSASLPRGAAAVVLDGHNAISIHRAWACGKPT